MCKPLEIETNLSEEFLYEKCFCVGIFFLNQVSHHSPFFFGGKIPIRVDNMNCPIGS
jgi:hypothetical protein